MSTDAQDPAELSIVYVIDDDESMRTAVDMLLRSVGLRVQAFATAHEFLTADKPDVPSCLILDVRLKGQSGLAVQEQIAAVNLQLPIIFMTAYGDIEMSVKAMKAGAMDFLAKPFREQDMLDAVSAALARDERSRGEQRARDDLRGRYETLSAREREVMAFVSSGLMNKQIAAEMNLSEITVKIHRGQAMKKMDARSLADFVRKAEALGITKPGDAATPRIRGS
ncbi:response regulator transcription factor [Burkholderia cepacia]|uniref:response regulator transcription factor n=1 Tax=Burkholderia cepacia TaxID=292 RepID=UPI000753F4F4|nr:response regulator [Burkholderia cepacia]KWC91605.1 hypothetical protein WL56_05570 [Burkholderia cepacia]